MCKRKKDCTQFDKVSKKMGCKYKKGFKKICVDHAYNQEKSLDSSLSIHQYIQAASEQIAYYHINKYYNPLFHDKRVNPSNQKDVDIVYYGEPFNLFIEVKTPEVYENTEDYKSDVLTIEQDHRYCETTVSRKDFENRKEQIRRHVNEIKSTENKKMDDNKIGQYLRESNAKMVDSGENGINILLICLNSTDFFRFYDYITNMEQGLFGLEPYVKKEDYMNVDFIVLSNCVEAHLDKRFKFNPWEFSHYLNFVIPNEYKGEKLIPKIDTIRNLFSDKHIEYINYRDNEFPKLYKDVPSNVTVLTLPQFIGDKYQMFSPNRNNRKYGCWLSFKKKS